MAQVIEYLLSKFKPQYLKKKSVGPEVFWIWNFVMKYNYVSCTLYTHSLRIILCNIFSASAF
jgi:hypothetical protein